MAGRVVVIGAPSCAGAYAPGCWEGPSALRQAGLIGRLRDRGLDVVDAGDVPRFVWRPDPGRPFAQNIEHVVAAARAVAALARDVLGADDLPLVLGGDCTTGTGAVAALAGCCARPGLIYLDRHADMNTPESVRDGALDWMGLGHMLALPGAAPEFVEALGAPLLAPERVCLLGFDPDDASGWENEQIAELGISVVAVGSATADPAESALVALQNLGDSDRFALHFDVDVLDFTLAPLSETTNNRNVGFDRRGLTDALRLIARDPRLSSVTVAQVNPTHAAALPGTLEWLVGALADGLRAAPALTSTAEGGDA